MKKLIAMLLAMVMVLSLAACGAPAAPAPTEAPKAEAPVATEAPVETPLSPLVLPASLCVCLPSPTPSTPL